MSNLLQLNEDHHLKSRDLPVPVYQLNWKIVSTPKHALCMLSCYSSMGGGSTFPLSVWILL